MNARGSTEVIIATIGLSMGVLSQNLFTMIVTMAMLTTMAMPPMLRAALSRLPMGKEEKERLEREAIEEKVLSPISNGCCSRWTRAPMPGLPPVLPASGRRARNADHRAACRRPCTDQEKNREDEASHETAIRNAAKVTAEAERSRPRRPCDDADRDKKVADAVVDEAKKGFDLLMVGMDKVLGAKDGFDNKIEDVTAGFEGPLAIVAGQGQTS